MPLSDHLGAQGVTESDGAHVLEDLCDATFHGDTIAGAATRPRSVSKGHGQTDTPLAELLAVIVAPDRVIALPAASSSFERDGAVAYLTTVYTSVPLNENQLALSCGGDMPVAPTGFHSATKNNDWNPASDRESENEAVKRTDEIQQNRGNALRRASRRSDGLQIRRRGPPQRRRASARRPRPASARA